MKCRSYEGSWSLLVSSLPGKAITFNQFLTLGEQHLARERKWGKYFWVVGEGEMTGEGKVVHRFAVSFFNPLEDWNWRGLGFVVC